MTTITKPVLAFDTALNGCVVAVVMPSGKAYTRVLHTEREQAAKLIPLIQETMAEAGCAFADLGLIVTSIGPGSFTGLRISLSSARSFGASLNIPVQGVSTLEAMAATCEINQDALVVLETKRADYYVQAFGKDGATSEASCMSADDIAAFNPTFVCGDAIERLQAEAGASLTATYKSESMLDPVKLATLGAEKFAANGGRAERPEPVYLRGADVSVSNKTQRRIKDPMHF